MIEVFIKIIVTIFIIYGGSVVVFNGWLTRPFIDTDPIPDDEMPPSGPTAKEMIGIILSVVVVFVTMVSLITIAWLV